MCTSEITIALILNKQWLKSIHMPTVSSIFMFYVHLNLCLDTTVKKSRNHWDISGIDCFIFIFIV